jgi:hypothetical protein
MATNHHVWEIKFHKKIYKHACKIWDIKYIYIYTIGHKNSIRVSGIFILRYKAKKHVLITSTIS